MVVASKPADVQSRRKSRPYFQQCSHGRQLAAKAMADLAADLDTPAFASNAEVVLALAPGVAAGFWARLAASLLNPGQLQQLS